MTEFKTAQLGDLLNRSQLKELAKLLNKQDVKVEEIIGIINKDNSKWKEILIPEYFAYAILNKFQRREIDGNL